MNQTRPAGPARILRTVALALAVCAVAARAPVALGDGAEPLLFHVAEGGSVVFTNIDAAGSSRPVPGWTRAAAPAAGRTAELPETIYDAFIERLAAEYGLAPRLIKAVALVESGLDPHAVSHKGAQGLMQLMPATAASYGVADAFDPLENLRAGAAHLRTLLDEFDGDLTLALAAYNAGSGAVRRAGGVPAYRETRNYVRRVRARLEPGGRDRPQTAETGEPLAEPLPPARPVRLIRQADGTVLLAN